MSNDVVQLTFDKAPNIATVYLKALTSRGGPLRDGQTIPRIEARLPAVLADSGNLTRYNAVCGFTDPDHLPITYPHIQAAAVHIEMMTQKVFPLPVMGLVHVRNAITQHRQIGINETLEMQIVVDGHRDLHNGVEFDLVSQAHSGGELVWEETTTILSRMKRKGVKKPAKTNEPEIQYERETQWELPANLGRRYGVIAGDINPIHMGKYPAKLFGFPRAIAHGMWSLARAAAELDQHLPAGPYTLNTAFRQPVLLPATVQFKYSQDDKGIHFGLFNQDSSKTHMTGSVSS